MAKPGPAGHSWPLMTIGPLCHITGGGGGGGGEVEEKHAIEVNIYWNIFYFYYLIERLKKYIFTFCI